MARADRRRGARAKQASGPAAHVRNVNQQNIEDTMFFVRIRKHAKWMFVFLAVIFAGGFVIFGVGANNAGTGIGDILQGSGGSDGVASVSDARERVAERPEGCRRAARARDRAPDRRANDEAIEEPHRVHVAPPQGRGRAARARRPLPDEGQSAFSADAQNAQTRGGLPQPRIDVRRAAEAGHRRRRPSARIRSPPRSRRRRTRRSTPRSRRPQTPYAQAVTTYERLVKVAPRDPQVQLELAQAAEQVRDYPRAIAAYRRFLVLAPDDASAEIVKAQIKQLQAALQPSTSG